MAGEIEKRFTYQEPKGDQPQRYEEIRRRFKEMATFISETTLSSREQYLALTNLEQSMMWTNAAISRNE